MAELQFVSLMSSNALGFCRELIAHLSGRMGLAVVLCDEPWQVAERRLYRGEAHLGVVCGLQYVLAVDRGEQPGMDLLAAPVMAGRATAPNPCTSRTSSSAQTAERGRWPICAARRGRTTSRHRTPATRSRATPWRREGYGRGFFGHVSGSGAHLRSLDWLLGGRIDASAIDSTVLEQELRTRALTGVPDSSHRDVRAESHPAAGCLPFAGGRCPAGAEVDPAADARRSHWTPSTVARTPSIDSLAWRTPTTTPYGECGGLRPTSSRGPTARRTLEWLGR